MFAKPHVYYRLTTLVMAKLNELYGSNTIKKLIKKDGK